MISLASAKDAHEGQAAGTGTRRGWGRAVGGDKVAGVGRQDGEGRQPETDGKRGQRQARRL